MTVDAKGLPRTRAATALTELVLEVFRLNGALLAAGDRLVAPLGLSSARWQVLGAIALAQRPEPVANLARNMGLTRQAVQRIVNDLADGRFVTLEPNPHHRRAQLVVLTAAGRKLYEGADQRQVPWVNALATGLKQAELRAATQTLHTVRRRLRQAKGQGG